VEEILQYHNLLDTLIHDKYDATASFEGFKPLLWQNFKKSFAIHLKSFLKHP